MRTFDEVWAEQAAKGYQYGPDALEGVRFGWELACQAPDELPPASFAGGNINDHEGFFAMGGRALWKALRAYHAGTDRGELMVLLREAWGPAPGLPMRCQWFRGCQDDTFPGSLFCAEHARVP